MGQLGATIGGAIIGGIIGSIVPGVGTVLGAQLGAVIGGTTYALLNPPKSQGPRLSDRKLQTAEYGSGIVWGRGVFRTAGTVFWQTDLEEHEHSSGGKGGGGGQTTYSYSASFAILICEGPIQGIRRIWIDNKVVWQGGEATAELPFKLYLGGATQDPDPTIEADPDIGSGNAPDYRGYAYIVLTDMDLSDTFNRIGNFEFEVEANGDPRLVRVSEWEPPGNNGSFTGQSAMPLDGAYLDGGDLVSCTYTEDSPKSTYVEKRYNFLTGELLDTSPTLDVDNPADSALCSYLPSTNSNVAFGTERGVGDPEMRWYVAGERKFEPVEPPTGLDWAGYPGRPLVIGHFVYMGWTTGGGTVYIGKWAFLDDTHSDIAGDAEDDYFDVSAVSANAATVATGQLVCLSLGSDGFLYASWSYGSDDAEMVKIDPETMAQVRYWDIPGSSGTVGDFISQLGGLSSLTIYHNVLCVYDSSPSEMVLYRINDDDTFTEIDRIACEHTTSFAPALHLGGGYVLVQDGVIRIDALDTVGACCAAISEYGHDAMTVGQYDVTDLPDKLRGFRISSPMTKANAIDALRNGYFFGYAEVDGKALFRHTSHDPDAEIPEDDLAAYQDGSEPPAKLKWVDSPDDEVPWRLILKFIDYDGDYQTGTAMWTRDTGNSRVETTLDLPVVLTYAEAKAIVDTHGMRAELERKRGVFTTTRKWLKIAPLDVLTIGDQTVRILDTQWALGEPVQFTCVPTKAALYSGIAIGSSGGTSPGGTGGGGGTTTQKSLAPTESVLMDIPAIEGGVPPYGFAWAAGPKNSGRWPGAILYKSYDGGTNYEEVARKSTPDIIGKSLDTLADYTDPLIDPDETNTFQVRLTRAESELVTITDDALDGGSNRFALEAGANWEIGQFRDTTLDSPQVYTNEYLLRGQLDTEAAIDDHADGDRFVMLPVQVVDAPESDLNVPIWYQAVTIGASISPTAWVQFTNTGNNTNTVIGGGSVHIPTNVVRHTGTSYTFVEADRTILHVFGDAGTVTVDLPDGLKKGWWVRIENLGAGDLVLTLTGSAELDEQTGDLTLEADQGIFLAFNGVDYWTVRGMGTGGGGGGSSPLTTKGDIYVYSSMDDRLGVGANGLTLIADSSQAKGMRWGSLSTTVIGDLWSNFGSGVDGDVTFDGVNAVTGWTRSGSTYTFSLGAIPNYNNVTIDAGVVLLMRQTPLFANGTLTNNGTIACTNFATRNASGATGGLGNTDSGNTVWGPGSAAGGAGALNAGAAGSGTAANALGGAGGASGSNASGAGSLGGTPVLPTNILGGLAYAYSMHAVASGRVRDGTAAYGGGMSGAGGRGTGAVQGGGGGGAGCPLYIYARFITGTGVFDAAGGDGAQGALNASGGGGGGGGVIFIFTLSNGWSATQTTNVSGGAPGAANGTGNAGVAGSAGRVIAIPPT